MQDTNEDSINELVYNGRHSSSQFLSQEALEKVAANVSW
jgi:hypothetical protein